MDDVLDDLHLRLDEFEQLLELGGRDASNCLFRQMPEMAKRYERMEELFKAVER